MQTYFNAFFSGNVEPFWPHVSLLSVSVLASFAVGAGIIFEAPKYSPSIHRVATNLVIAGVVVEALCTICLFAFDEGISNAQQSKIIALETKIASRDLSPEQEKSIAAKIKEFSGMHFDLSMTTEIEPMRLLDKVEDSLILGEWIEQPPSSGFSVFNRMGKPNVAVHTVAGVWVLYPKKSGPEFEKAAKALRAALDAEGLVGSFITIDPGDPSDLGAIHVWVGGKP
jgi:hypothetical protein